ncbi:MAG: trypsin-like peptidase domain-containing protein [Myxococcota bacterium]|nr:trypsin-like peptidase domain-containing protein [Myxococcota bacterium]
MKFTILYDSGSRAGEAEDFSDATVIRLGRHPENDCVFDDPADRTVSGFHAEIMLSEGNPVIVDKRSTNGVLVNGKWAEESPLAPGDLIELGKDGPTFRVQFKAEPSHVPQQAIWEGKTEQVERPSAASNLTGQDSSGNGDDKFFSYPVSRATASMPQGGGSTEPASQDKKYGEKTVGMMIERVLAQAGLKQPRGTSKSTDYFEALVEKRVKTTSSRLKRIVFFSSLFVLIIGGGVGYYAYKSRPVQVYHTTQVSYGDVSGSAIAAANRYAIFMVAGREILSGVQQRSTRGFCTAFAITRDVLATNAHCVMLAKEKYRQTTAIMNGAPAHRFPIVKSVVHSGYKSGQISPDVGLFRIRGQLTNLVTIAPPKQLAEVTTGAPMFLYGFPGRLNREDAPEATFVKGDIGRVTGFDQRLGDFGKNTLLQHSAYSSSGTSGSPIFNAAGQVIGINTGGYVENGNALSGYNFAMRIDLINELLPGIQKGQ